MTEFKWNNRKKATEIAIQLKGEGLSPEEAVKKVLAEHEGVYFVNGKDISEKRYQNFIQRVAEDKQYKTPSKEPVNLKLKQAKIKTLVEKAELTELQAIVLDTIFNSLETNKAGLSDLTLAEVAESAGIKLERVKGSLGHLIKKNYVKTVEQEVDGETVATIYIDPSKYGLYNDDVTHYHEATEEVSTQTTKA